MWKILLIDKNVSYANQVAKIINNNEKKIVLSHSNNNAIQRIKGEQFHLIIISDTLPENECYKILELAMMIDENMPIILNLNQTKLEDYKDIIKPYTWNIVEGEFALDALKNRVNAIIDHIKLNHRIRYLTHKQKYIFRFDNIVGVSDKFQKVLLLVKKIAKSDSIILIQGETGTGKELIAAALHYNSKRCRENFVAVNCAALNENLLESELFGHEKGSFTGAHNLRIGRFEQANCGTLFLDEIGEMSLSVQAKVLRVLENQEFERVGSSKTIKVDVRVVAATNRNLEEEVRERRFRQDLFYRLSVIPINIPPLRERKEDVMPLTMFFFNKYKKKGEIDLKGFHPDCLSILEDYSWPGNIRELENVIERAILIADKEYLLPEDLLIPQALKTNQVLKVGQSQDNQKGFSISLPSSKALNLRIIEKQVILQALKTSGWIQKEAAKLLGISSRVINYKIKKHRLERKDYSQGTSDIIDEY